MPTLTQDKDGRWIAAIPEPYWYAGWKTLFRFRPQCCNHIFNGRAAYEEHYVINHLKNEDEDGLDQ